MNDRQVPLLVPRLQWRERRVQAKKSIQIDDSIATSPGGLDRDVLAGLVILPIAVRNNHAQAIDGTSLKHAHQYLSPALQRRRGTKCSAHKTRSQAEGNHRQAACADKHPAGNTRQSSVFVATIFLRHEARSSYLR